MSKNDFDNARQNTEFTIESWEEIDEHQLNNKLNKIRITSAQNNEHNNFDLSSLTTYDSGSRFSNMMINDGNYQSSETCAQSSSTFKILKRPTENSNKVNDNLPKTKIPLKSLKQREKEYAEARLRILGSASHLDDAKNVTDAAINQPRITPNQEEELNRVLRMPIGPTEGGGFKVRNSR